MKWFLLVGHFHPTLPRIQVMPLLEAYFALGIKYLETDYGSGPHCCPVSQYVAFRC
jgi:hypothetical protein